MVAVKFTEKEMGRILVVHQVGLRQITQVEAGSQLGISSRQIRRLKRRFESEGAVGLKYRHRGGNRALKAEVSEQIVCLLQEKYRGFGPTLASEKLLELDQIRVSRETVRRLMITSGIHISKKRRKARVHQHRERRSRFGELVQIDGSHHDWFEGRAAKCCLLVFVDDATSQIVQMRFEQAETTNGYLRGVQSHLSDLGRPVSYYSDKHSIFRKSIKECTDGRIEPTQLGRALKELDIKLICANSSQAKGRVERANGVLQDRLIKEMRLRSISNIEEANAFLPEFQKDYNRRFGKEPQSSEDAHKEVYHSQEALYSILSRQYTRTVSKNLEFSFKCGIYQIQSSGSLYKYRRAKIKIYLHTDGNMSVMYKKEYLKFKKFKEQAEQPPVVDCKELNGLVDQLISSDNTPAIACHA